MTGALVIFLSSVFLGIVLTPLVARIGRRLDILDKPADRKIHQTAIPRIGGVAIYIAFLLPVAAGALLGGMSSPDIFGKLSLPALLGGATLVFLLGLVDDVHPLSPGVKFLIQTVGALLAYFGGLQMTRLEIPFGAPLELGKLSLPITILWYLLVVNGINLIDGLDGLAAGVCLFASLVLLAFGFMGDHHHVALGLAAIAGSCLGFLRYNFNPASIFMGDAGSYFLGYVLASLGILGSLKSQTTVAILIPALALGLPLMDAVLAPIRRLVLGREPFEPDRGHVHHKLLKLGLSQREAVLAMYGATLVLGGFALLMVNARDERAAGLLLALGIILAAALCKLGYLEHLAVDKVMGCLQDVTHGMGLSRDRSAFLDGTVAVAAALDCKEGWDCVVGEAPGALEAKATRHRESDDSSTNIGARSFRPDDPVPKFRHEESGGGSG